MSKESVKSPALTRRRVVVEFRYEFICRSTKNRLANISRAQLLSNYLPGIAGCCWIQAPNQLPPSFSDDSVIKVELATVDQSPEDVLQSAPTITRIGQDPPAVFDLVFCWTAAESDQIQFLEGIDVPVGIPDQL